MGKDCHSEHLGPERRHPGQAEQSPEEKLRQMPAHVVLERLPDPALAVAHDGTILFANSAFGEMLGCAGDELTGRHICQFIPDLEGPTPFSAVREASSTLVELAHRGGFRVQALMSISAMLRRDDALALITFNDCTELLWATGKQRQTCSSSTTHRNGDGS
jgi:PAS domain S-box-containing protein